MGQYDYNQFNVFLNHSGQSCFGIWHQTIEVQLHLFFYYFRQYEERELQIQQERAKKRLEFENQKFRLQNQIEFERSRDTIGILTNHYYSEAEFIYIIICLSSLLNLTLVTRKKQISWIGFWVLNITFTFFSYISFLV